MKHLYLLAGIIILTRTGRIAILGLLSISLPGCVTAPSPGERFIMVVDRIPNHRSQLQYHPGLSLALSQGLARSDITAGRVFTAGCYEDSTSYIPGTGRRHGHVYIPEGTSVKAGDIVQISAEEADGTPLPYARFYGKYLNHFAAHESDYFDYKYSPSGRAFQCTPSSANGIITVEIYSRARHSDFDHARSESSRNDQIRDDELEQGRIIIGKCSPGVDSRLFWKARIPPGMDIEAGEYVEAIAGSYESTRSLGPISEVTRKVAKPEEQHFIATHGQYTVSCDAYVEP